MPRKPLWLTLTFALAQGCASTTANLTTEHPDTGPHTFFFSKRLLSSKSSGSTLEEQHRAWEKQLAAFLAKDPNTSTCAVIPNSIDFGEPGSAPLAQVQCTKPPPFEASTTGYTLRGTPIYRYWIKGESGI